MVEHPKQMQLMESCLRMGRSNERTKRGHRGCNQKRLIEIGMAQPILRSERPFIAHQLIQCDQQRFLLKAKTLTSPRWHTAERRRHGRKGEIEASHLLSHSRPKQFG